MAMRRALSSGAGRLFSAAAHGTKYSPDFRVTFTSGAKEISPWHDIPLVSASGAHHFICEMPRGERGKFEINTKVPGNPIIQDVKNGKLRMINYSPVLHNYGALPQTYEDPEVAQPAADGLFGDADPLDVVDIGAQAATIGEVYEVHLLGALGLIDEGECDWKIIAIRSSDPLAAGLKDIGDVPANVIADIHSWYELYKTADGKPRNSFINGGKAFSRERTLELVDECHQMWKRLPKA